jgi:tripartite-type tricarboxylate transporter receptor subunit TctC
VRVIVPYAAGGAADFLGRIFAEQLTEKLGQSFFVENRPGGGIQRMDERPMTETVIAA